MTTRILVDGTGRPYFFDAGLWKYGLYHVWEPWWWPFWLSLNTPAPCLGDTERN